MNILIEEDYFFQSNINRTPFLSDTKEDAKADECKKISKKFKNARAWVRVGMYVHIESNPYNDDDISKELTEKLKNLILPEGYVISGDSYIPDSCIEIDGENIDSEEIPLGT